MKPLDPRLLRYARSARSVLGFGGLLGLVRSLAVIAWCWCAAQAIAALVIPVLGNETGRAGRVAEWAPDPGALPGLLAGAALAVIVRSGASWGIDLLAARGAVRVKAQLRSAALDALDARSPVWLAERPDAAPTTALGRGLDALDGYFSNYLPQLILTGCATPLLVLAVLLADPVSGITVLLVFPVIPVFMVLIGLATRSVQERQWAQLQRLSGAFLDAVEGLATLRIFRREQHQVARIARETGEYRSRTMHVLRVAFLSGFVLDLAGTFSIAIVAVTVGTRLVVGEFPLALGLFVLLLLPEVFIPIRQVGAAFHASAEGLTAAEDVFAIIEGQDPESRPAAAHGGSDHGASDHGASDHSVSDHRGARPGIVLDRVVIERGGRPVVGPISFAVSPGEVVALTGPSGSGKSTLVAALLGFVEPCSGTLASPAALAWAGQQPGLLQGSVAENVALGAETRDPARIRRALAEAGLPELDTELELGASGAGLSGGQAQRVAIARAMHRAWTIDAEALILDEPSSALDAASEARVAQVLRAEAAAGRAVLVVSHRPELIGAADRVVRIGAAA